MTQEQNNTMHKIEEILNQPNFSENLRTFLSSLTNSDKNSSNSNPHKLDGDFSQRMLGMISHFKGSQDHRSQLFSSIRPFLKESRKEKVEQVEKILKIITMAQIFMENKELFS